MDLDSGCEELGRARAWAILTAPPGDGTGAQGRRCGWRRSPGARLALVIGLAVGLALAGHLLSRLRAPAPAPAPAAPPAGLAAGADGLNTDLQGSERVQRARERNIAIVAWHGQRVLQAVLAGPASSQ